MKRILPLFLAVLTVAAARAEDGYDLWLRYRPLEAPLQAVWRPAARVVVSASHTPTAEATRSELVRGLSGLLGRKVAAGDSVADGAVLFGTPANAPTIAALNLKLGQVGAEGFVIRSVQAKGKSFTVIAGNSEIGALYGAFAYLRHLQSGASAKALDIVSAPKIQRRLLNHWDNVDRTIERGFAGFSIFNWWELPGHLDPRYTDYARANAALGALPDAVAMALAPPAIDSLGNSSGFNFRLQDKAQQGYAALASARDQLLKAASQSPILQGVYVEGLPTAPQIELMIDRQKANALGVAFASINEALSTSLGSVYVNDFPSQGRMQQVIVQADAARRMKPDDLLHIHVRNAQGQMTPLQSFARIGWTMGPAQVVGYNGYPSIKFSGSAAPGYASGDAMAEMERLAAQLPPGFEFAWTGQSLQEKLSGSQAIYLFALSLLSVFLCLAALYESWSIPLVVLLAVPTGGFGAVVAMLLRDLPNDIYFKVGLVTVVGLTAKNAILIVEVARAFYANGRPLREAALAACELRFRPIVMTSFAFILGVTPLALATGAGMNSQRAIGTGVLGGMVAATALAVFVTPLLYVLIGSVSRRKSKRTLASPVDRADMSQTV